MLGVTEFADWVLGIVAVLFIGGVGASIKAAIDVAVIKNMLKHGDRRFSNLDEAVTELKRGQKKHSDRIRDLENPPSNPNLKPRRT